MGKDKIFSAEIKNNFEESIRVDRDRQGGIEDKSHPLNTYHLTQESQAFLDDFFRRLTDESDEMRKGANHWLYGYYGSGKSHLLSVLGFLTNSDEIDVSKEEKNNLWKALSKDEDYKDLKKRWDEATYENYLIPVSINLLKHQGAEEVSLSQILSRKVHEEQGFSSRLEVAHFEKWFKQKDEWERRDEIAREIVESRGIETDEKITWETHIRKYKALSELVLPEIFQRITGSKEGYQDLTPDRLGPEKAVEQIEEWRQEEQKKEDRDVKIILLLDEVSLFMGSEFDKLTELNSLAEKIDDIGQGNIQLVATAQESVEEVHKDLASKGPGFSIVKDRFPHRYNLPSKHASEIVRNRLLKKSDFGKKKVRDLIESTDTLDVSTQLKFTDINKNMSPSLDAVNEELFTDYYPALPYHTPLFMEILANMRESAADSSKSVFSGTTRAILAIIHGLLNEWEENSKETEIINLVDFFDLIRYEIEEVAEREEKVIDNIEDDFGKKSRESDLAKVILLLNQVSDFIPSKDDNLAIGIMKDLEGKTRHQMLGEVDKGLEGLEEYIKEDGEEEKRFRFTTPQERKIYKKKESKLKDSNWNEIIESVDEEILYKALEKINIPTKKKFSAGGEEFKINYKFSTSGRGLNTSYGDESGLTIPVILSGLQPDEEEPQSESGKIIWQTEKEGKEEIRSRIREWWALEEAYENGSSTPYLEKELEKKKESAVDSLARTLTSSSYKVREKELSSLSRAIEECVKQRYFGSFHPLMTKISSENLRELKSLEKGDKLPGWALKIQVPPNRDDVTLDDKKIMNTVRATTGKKLQEHGTLNLNTIIDYLNDEESLYEECELAVLAILWGLSRNRKEFIPVDESGDPLEYEDILEPGRTHEVRLKLDETESEKLSEILQKYGFQDTTDTKDQGIRNLGNKAEEVGRRFDNLITEIELVQDDIRTEEVQRLIQKASENFSDQKKYIKQRKDDISSKSPDYIEIAKQVKKKEDEVEQFSSALEYRKKRLLRTDILLTLAENAWTSDKTISIANNIREDLEKEANTEWWTEEEWSRLTSQISDYELKNYLDQDWEKFKSSNSLNEVKDLIDSSSISEFSKGSPELQKNYIIPAKNFYTDLDKMEEGLGVILSDSEEQESKMLEARKKIESARISEYSVKSLKNKVEKIIEITSSLSDVKLAGVWPEDRTNLRKALKDDLKEDETDIEEVEGGIIIK